MPDAADLSPEVSSSPTAAEPTRRLILTGASNLTRGLASVVAMARQAWQGPWDVLAAPGNGRSYGWTTNVVGRRLGGIVDCGLWTSWSTRPPLPTYGVVADVGNDVMYGATVEQILSWVDAVLERLALQQVKTVVVGLPLGPVGQLGPRRYAALRSVLFPGNRTDFAAAMQRAAAVDAGLRERARRCDAAFVEPCAAWYGWDPIHVRRAYWGEAWGRVLTALEPPAAVRAVRVRPWSWVASQFWRPERRHLLGIERRCAQPSVRFVDGTRISLF